MSQTTGGPVEQAKEYIAHLTRLSDGIDPTDLGELAQIHEDALKLAETGGSLAEGGAERLAALGRKTAEITESIILESCSQPRETLAGMCQTLQRLGQLVQALGTLPDAEVLQECLTALNEPAAVSSNAPPGQPEQPAAPITMEVDAAPAPKPVEAPEIREYHPEPLVLAESEFEYVQSFLTESQEHIENVEAGLLTLEQSPDDLEKINELFRPFHTIKGMAGFLNLRDVQALTHEVETLLDLGRKGKLKITPPIIDLTFETLDVLKVQIQSIGQYMAHPTGQAIPQPPIEELLRRVALAARGIFEPAVLAPSGKPGARRPLGEILAEESSVAPELVEFALQQQAIDKKPVGQILAAMGAARPQEVSQALRKQKNEVADAVVRVDTAKLDSLVNLVGELVIIQTQVEQNAVVRQSPPFARLVEQVSKITRDLQEVAMSMRMVPIGQTFQKMGRVLRDLSRKVDKKVNYEIDGEETELDKNVIQELSDPLMHMIRNAVDHGIESPDVRVKAGKPETGTVKLSASHQGGNIVIQIADDGKGLDKDVLVRKAIDKGLIAPDAILTEQQAFGLIMAAGFSTAEKVTDISGRGVGMDVVKKNIDKLRGKIEIHSVLGHGTTFTIRLPLTLAVIDGMILRVGRQKFVLPTLSIVQSLSPTPDQLQTVQGRGQILNLRGRVYPLLSLGPMFHLSNSEADATKSMVVIAQAGDLEAGLIVDELLGQQQVVIKSLGDRFKGVRGIAGGAILGDGTIGLILEPAGLLDVHQQAITV